MLKATQIVKLRLYFIKESQLLKNGSHHYQKHEDWILFLWLNNLIVIIKTIRYDYKKPKRGFIKS